MDREVGGKGKGKYVKFKISEIVLDYYCNFCNISFKFRFIYFVYCNGKTYKKRKRFGKKIYEDVEELVVEEVEGIVEDFGLKVEDEKESKEENVIFVLVLLEIVIKEEEEEVFSVKESEEVKVVEELVKREREVIELECKICD